MCISGRNHGNGVDISYVINTKFRHVFALDFLAFKFYHMNHTFFKFGGKTLPSGEKILKIA